MKSKIIAVLAATLLLAACSSIKPYESKLAPNMELRYANAQKQFFTSTNAELDLYKQGKKACDLDYMGTTDFSRDPKSIGVPTGEYLYMNVARTTGGFFTSTNFKDIRVRFKPQAGKQYVLTYELGENSYDLNLEQKVSGGARKEVRLEAWDKCQ